MPLFATETQAIAALGSYLNAWARLGGARRRPSAPVGRELPVGPGRALDEAAGLAVASAAGIPVIEHRLCTTRKEAVGAYAQLARCRSC